jgi:hypothetical protein
MVYGEQNLLRIVAERVERTYDRQLIGNGATPKQAFPKRISTERVAVTLLS